LGEEFTRKIKGYESVDNEEETPMVKNPVQKDLSFKGLFDMKFMRQAKGHHEADFEEMKETVSSEKRDIVTIPSQRSHVQSEILIEKVPQLPSEKAVTVFEKVPASIPSENPWLSKKRKRGCLFVSAASFHQLTDTELAAGEDRVNLARRDEQREVLFDAMDLSSEFAAQKLVMAEREFKCGVDDLSLLHLDGWGLWAGPGAVESDKTCENHWGSSPRKERCSHAACYVARRP
jgi:U3 small nucleolar RNA-associated protein 14